MRFLTDLLVLTQRLNLLFEVSIQLFFVFFSRFSFISMLPLPLLPTVIRPALIWYFSVLFEFVYCCIFAVFYVGKSSSPFLLKYRINLRHISDVKLCAFSPISHLFICLKRFMLEKLFSRKILGFLWSSFYFFLSSLLVYWYMFPINQGTCYFFLQVFKWFPDLVILFSPHSLVFIISLSLSFQCQIPFLS